MILSSVHLSACLHGCKTVALRVGAVYMVKSCTVMFLAGNFLFTDTLL